MKVAVAGHTRRFWLPLFLAGSAACVGACVESIGGRAVSSRLGAPPGLTPLQATKPGPTPLRRLAREEYDYTIRDLLGVASTPAPTFAPDDLEGPFFSNTTTPVSALHLQQYQEAAQYLASSVVSDVARLKTLLPCAPPVAAAEGACADELIRGFGKRAYRRPLQPAEVDRYRALFSTGRTGADFSTGITLVLEAMLSSPNFLYHVELGGAPMSGQNAVPFTPFEIASRLSYFLWRSMPDERLLAAAEAGRLARSEEVAQEAVRMMKDDKTRRALGSFTMQWLELGDLATVAKDRKLFPTFTPELRAAMQDEVVRLTDFVLRDGGDGRLATWLTASYTFANGPLAAHYGLKGVSSSWTRVDLPAGQRAGVLSTAAAMTVHAHPDQTSLVLRGLMIRKGLLCTIPPPPPPGVANNAPPVDPDVSARERFEQHRNDVGCSSCHKLMDPLGAPFEIYDAIGRYRKIDGKQPVDSSGALTGTATQDGPVANPVDLARKLLASSELGACMVKQWFRFGLGRMETAEDVATLAEAGAAFSRADLRVPDLLAALVRSRTFRERRPVVP